MQLDLALTALKYDITGLCEIRIEKAKDNQKKEMEIGSAIWQNTGNKRGSFPNNQTVKIASDRYTRNF